MEIKRLRTLPIELFKAINNINQSFMKDIFTQLDLITSLLNITRLQYGDNTMIALGPKMWNQIS